jgi:hypothetical protein
MWTRIRRATVSLPLIVVALCAWAATANAMHVMHDFIPVAYSPDGAHLLVRAVAHGPEGGGSEAFEIWGPMPPNRVRFEVSSDFSPGGGTHPQTISVGVCAQHLRELDMALKARGFTDIEMLPNACTKRSGAYLKTSQALETQVHDAVWQSKDGAFVRDEYRLRKKGNDWAVEKKGAAACSLTIDPGHVHELSVGGYKPDRLVYVIAHYDYVDQALVGLCAAAADGKLQPLPIR